MLSRMVGATVIMLVSMLFTSLVCCQCLADRVVTLPFSKFTKLDKPILEPTGYGFDAAAVYNPAVVYVNGAFYMFYRAQAKWKGTSVVMLANSSDGVHFRRLNITVLYPTLKWEIGGGCEDPRIVEVNGTYYMTYTAYDGETARLALARSKDLIHWEKLGLVLPDWGWCKSGAILPVKVNGRYIMYFGDSNIWIAYSSDMIHWVTDRDWVVLRPRKGFFDSKLVEPGPPPILTDHGILLIYNGADEDNRYSIGWALFSLDEPSKVIARSSEPILEPTLLWERDGQVPNVVFATSLVDTGDKWLLYYGSADTYVGLAVANKTLYEVSIVESVEEIDHGYDLTYYCFMTIISIVLLLAILRFIHKYR